MKRIMLALWATGLIVLLATNNTSPYVVIVMCAGALLALAGVIDAQAEQRVERVVARVQHPCFTIVRHAYDWEVDCPDLVRGES